MGLNSRLTCLFFSSFFNTPQKDFRVFVLGKNTQKDLDRGNVCSGDLALYINKKLVRVITLEDDVNKLRDEHSKDGRVYAIAVCNLTKMLFEEVTTHTIHTRHTHTRHTHDTHTTHTRHTHNTRTHTHTLTTHNTHQVLFATSSLIFKNHHIITFWAIWIGC